MKLEPKHIAPYIPYGLEAIMLDCKIDYVGKQIDKIVGLHQCDKSGTLWCCLTEGGSKPNISQIKPIFKSIFSFCNEDNLADIQDFIGLNNWCEAYEDYFSIWFDDIANVDKLVLQAPRPIFEYFLFNRYDVFGLIPKGLAQDCTTTKS